ncbi:MAG: DUF99 family protein [Thermoplasmata archaeon]|nr:DUF99 family protein [Thermoplasmata archaeon]
MAVKRHLRALGVDDAPFRRGQGECTLVGVLVRAPSYVEGFVLGRVSVDGEDATGEIARMANSRIGRVANVIMVNGVAVAGLNVVDLRGLSRLTGRPVISVSKNRPRRELFLRALKKVPGWEERWRLIEDLETVEIDGLYVHPVGLGIEDLRKVIENFQFRGKYPEPLRIAHLLARALVMGESKG